MSRATAQSAYNCCTHLAHLGSTHDREGMLPPRMATPSMRNAVSQHRAMSPLVRCTLIICSVALPLALSCGLDDSGLGPASVPSTATLATTTVGGQGGAPSGTGGMGGEG